MEDIEALFQALTNKEHLSEEERIHAAGKLAEVGGQQAVDLLRKAFTNETLKVQIAIGYELLKTGDPGNVDFFIAEMEKGTPCAANLLKGTGEIRAFQALMAHTRKHLENPILMQIVDDFARRYPLDDASRQDYNAFTMEMEQRQRNINDPAWVLENMSFPEGGRGGETRDQILAKLGDVESFTPGAGTAEFCKTYHGLREYRIVRRMGKDTW
ncbi:MAG TPA: HEAT repeat domain-containing protein, partial [Longilinea sp.]|nr:HEAT repeat domain-containing protein [Longilinea sp.]